MNDALPLSIRKINFSPRFIFSVLMILFYFAVAFGLKSVFSDTAGTDSETVERLAELGDTSNVGTSYAATAFVYSIFPEALRLPFVYLTGCYYIVFCIRRTTGWAMAIALSFLLIIPCLTAIGTFQKDLLLVWFIIPVAWSLSRRNIAFGLIVFFVFYLSYATIFRSYFYLVTASILAIYFLLSKNLWLRIFSITMAVLFFSFVPVEFLALLQEPRDHANARRIYEGLAGSRTAFLNPYPVNSLLNFFLNYINSFWMLDLSLFSRNFGAKEAFLLMNVSGYLSAIYFAFKSSSFNIRFMGSIVAGHFFFIHVFEPDSGSYLRHLSCTLPFVATILNDAYWRKHQRAVLNESKVG